MEILSRNYKHMVFKWEESDSEYEDIRSTNEVSLSDIIYGFDCAECGEDPDDPVWYYTCHDCGLRYSVEPTKVKACAYDKDL